MVKKCIYCKCGIDENSVVDVCQGCGIGVWGETMFNAIIQNMEGAREKGDLFQGNVGGFEEEKPKIPMSIIEEGIKNAEAFSNEKEELSEKNELLTQPIAREPVIEFDEFSDSGQEII